MATKRVSRAPEAPASKQSDWPPSCERAAAVHFMAEQGQLADVRHSYFCAIDVDLPIAGTPAPKPCPFCGVTNVYIHFSDVSDGKYPSAHAECEHCGAEAPPACEDEDPYRLAMEAARLWNTRGGAK